MYLDISGHIWMYLDIPRCIWIEMAEPSLRYCILFPGSDRMYLDISGHIWSYLVKDEYKYEVKWCNDSIQTSSTPCPAGAKTVLSLMRIMRIMFEYSSWCPNMICYILQYPAVFCSIIQLIYIELYSSFVCLRLPIWLLYMAPPLFNLAWRLKVLGSILLTCIRTS